jgi:drug/metabolite transporter (DMT)-like permease
MISETPTILQWIGMFLFLAGILLYFYPIQFSENQTLGFVIMIIGVLANALSAILGRDINRGGKITPYLVTLISMGVGSTILLLVGILTQGLPLLSMKNILYLIWLAIVNTALAFTIWNFTLRTLTAMESSVINGTMLVQIAVLAFFFLGESISFREGIGLFLAGTGAVIVQLKFKERNMQNGSFLTRRQ